jgi:hypothetical protein
LFFDPYKRNKITGSFILIDPITHNTAAVGMIIGKAKNSDSQSISVQGVLHQTKDAQAALAKYNELKLKGRTVVRMDEAELISQFGEIPNEKHSGKFVEMLLGEGIDVVK